MFRFVNEARGGCDHFTSALLSSGVHSSFPFSSFSFSFANYLVSTVERLPYSTGCTKDILKMSFGLKWNLWISKGKIKIYSSYVGYSFPVQHLIILHYGSAGQQMRTKWNISTKWCNRNFLHTSMKSPVYLEFIHVLRIGDAKISCYGVSETKIVLGLTNWLQPLRTLHRGSVMLSWIERSTDVQERRSF